MRYEGTYIYYIIYLKTIKRIYALRVFRKSIYYAIIIIHMRSANGLFDITDYLITHSRRSQT